MNQLNGSIIWPSREIQQLIDETYERDMCLNHFRNFIVNGSGGRNVTIEEEDLVPAALVKFKPIETDTVVFTGLMLRLLLLLQLTTFYAGKVNVFDDISPEKAQAIILLAGNGCVSSNMAQPRLCIDPPASKLAAADEALSGSTPPANSEDIKVSNSLGFSTNLVSKVEPPIMVTSLGSIAATAIISSAVLQARKASLARFLEKRKEKQKKKIHLTFEFTKSSGVPLLLSNKESILPDFASSKSEQYQTLSKFKSDPLVSPGDITQSAAVIFDATQKRQSGNIQV
ncbi:unnamed protein product [Fraxinus pennsylvanica]|uniref:Protein TIFY n=1 Tax=Fraxinus pennsylvanica TaxID=56036 RepID=A0AAD1YRJ7_9LAMI|nr:unnamed protein product [Fraxinus pennsylvanica]